MIDCGTLIPCDGIVLSGNPPSSLSSPLSRSSNSKSSFHSSLTPLLPSPQVPNFVAGKLGSFSIIDSRVTGTLWLRRCNALRPRRPEERLPRFSTLCLPCMVLGLGLEPLSRSLSDFCCSDQSNIDSRCSACQSIESGSMPSAESWWIRKGGGVTLREICRGKSGNFIDSLNADSGSVVLSHSDSLIDMASMGMRISSLPCTCELHCTDDGGEHTSTCADSRLFGIGVLMKSSSSKVCVLTGVEAWCSSSIESSVSSSSGSYPSSFETLEGWRGELESN